MADLAYYKAHRIYFAHLPFRYCIMTSLTIELPDKLAKEANDAGLFAPEIY